MPTRGPTIDNAMTKPIALIAGLFAAAFLGAVLTTTFLTPAAAGNLPANKMSASGASIDIGAPGETLDILSGVLRTASPEDLVVTVSLECDILTQVTTVGNSESTATARIVVWVTDNGNAIPVSSGDDGTVVFCDRVHQQETSLFDDQNATIRSFQQTRTANSFTWTTLNVGSGVHSIVAHATLSASTSGDGALANAVIGKRTMIVDPTKLANDATI